MRNLGVLAGVFASLALPVGPAWAQPAGPASAGTEAPTPFQFPSSGEIRDFIQSYVDAGMAEGIVVGLLHPDGRREYYSAGSAGSGAQPLGAMSVFEIGSISKTFTGTILADMVRKGEVALDDPVQKYLPADVRVPSRNGRQITLIDLATHRSGLPRLPTGYTPPIPANPYTDFAEADLYAFLNRHELERDPGTKALYSNLGVGLLGHALARAAGAESWKALVRQRILEPLEMTTTAYGRPPALASRMAVGNSAKGVVPYWDVGVLAGAGGLNSNAVDMMKYLDANLGAPTSELEKAMRDAQMGRGTADGMPEGASVALGWSRVSRGDRTLVGHGGGTAGFSTYIGLDPFREAGVVVLSNRGEFDYADYIGRNLLDPEWRSAIALDAPARGEYVGRYEMANGSRMEVTEENGRLFAQLSGQPKLPIYAQSPDRFFLRILNAQIEFGDRSEGQWNSIALLQRGRKLPGERID